MSEQEVVEAMSPVHPLPGSLLRQAREAAGLTLGEVAAALKFSVRQIEALENDNFDLLQGKTFLRGFIRSYARMLRLQPESLLAMLEEETLPSELIVPPENMGETNPVPFYRRHGKKILGIVAVVSAAAGLIWLYGDKAQYQYGGTAVQSAAVALPDTSNIAQSAPQAVTQPDASASTAIEGASAPAAATTSAPVLSFDFSGLSWLEVKDATGQVLLTGEFPAGQKQTASGKPPYQVWIGKASVVKVTYKNQAIDLLPYTRDEIARLTVDQ